MQQSQSYLDIKSTDDRPSPSPESKRRNETIVPQKYSSPFLNHKSVNLNEGPVLSPKSAYRLSPTHEKTLLG